MYDEKIFRKENGMSKKTLILILTGAVVIIGVVLFFVLRSSSDSYYNIQIMETLGVKSNRTIYKYLQQKGIKTNRK